MIKTLTIRNFRSIEDLEIELKPLNALIGSNSSGKSNIIEALNLIVGSTYPSVRSFTESDFYLYDKSRTIYIEVKFQNPINYKDYEVHGFRLTYDRNNTNYVAISKNGRVLTYHSGSEIKVNNEMRDKVTMMYLPLDRQAYQQISASQWKVYGKLLSFIASQISDSDKKLFREHIENIFKNDLYKYIYKAENLLRDYVQKQIGIEINLRLSIINPTAILNELRPKVARSKDFEVDIEAEGAGVQSAVAISIARTYAKLVKQPLILAIEEPELYLHPHGCRHFYTLLKDLSNNGIQVIYTTHERSFVNITDFESIFLVKKEGIKTIVCTGTGSTIPNFNIIKIASKFDEEMNEIFFAKKVILVEGPDDKIACKLALEKLDVELNKYNISIIDCGGNTGIRPILEILNKFGIEAFVLVDEDPGNKKTQNLIKQIKQLIGDDKIFLQSPNLEGIFKQSSKFNKKRALAILPQWFNSNPVPLVYKELKNRLKV